MVTKGYNLYRSLIINILLGIKNINGCRQRFMVEAVTLFLSIKGRINFQQLARYGKYNEQRYRIQFEKPFDFMAFNSGLVRYYRLRFQIEFIYRDAKQFTGLENCRARSENKLDFHFNMTLTATNVTKVAHRISIPEKERGTFSWQTSRP